MRGIFELVILWDLYVFFEDFCFRMVTIRQICQNSTPKCSEKSPKGTPKDSQKHKKISKNPIQMKDILELFDKEPNLPQINKSNPTPNERYQKSLEEDKRFLEKNQ